MGEQAVRWSLKVSKDTDMNLALSEAARADYLVTGDRNGLHELDNHKGTRIISASDFASLFA